MNKKSVLTALVSALLALGSLRAAAVSPAAFEISNLTFDHAVLMNMVNQALSNTGENNLISAGTSEGVVSVTIKNVGGSAAPCVFTPIVKEGGNGAYNCNSNSQVAT